MGIDLYGPLPVTPAGHRWVVTAVDHLTRYAETAPLRTGCAVEVAEFFLHSLFWRHGPPRALLSDRGKTFLSAVLAEVLRAANTVHKTTSSYHPQTNGLTERFHRTLSDMLSAYIRPDHTNWDTILPFVTYAYNSAVQRTTGFSPYYLVYGRPPPSVLDSTFFFAAVYCTENVPAQFVARVAYCRQLARENTEASQHLRKSHYDEPHRSVSFQPGDQVLLWTPVRQPGVSEKLLSRFIGPYTVLQQTSPVNYRVAPNNAVTDRRCRGTEIVHVSRLKPYVHRSDTP